VVARSEAPGDPRVGRVAIADAELMMSEYLVCLRGRGRLPVVIAFLELARGGHTASP